MESRISVVMGRMEEIQQRIAALSPPVAPARGGALSPTPLNPSGASSPAGIAPFVPPAERTLPGFASGAPVVGLAPLPARPFDAVLAQAAGKVRLRPMAGPFPADIENLITKYAAQNGVSAELVRAVIHQESQGNPRSLSATGAKGLMQVSPEMARVYGINDPFDPEQNISAGTRHLAGLMTQFNNNTEQAVAAYKAGSAAVRQYNGAPPFAETQQYVRRIMGMLNLPR